MAPAATLIARTFFSQSAWKIGSSFSGTTGRSPSGRRDRQALFASILRGGQADADHRVAADDRGELVLAPAFRALRPHRDDDEAGLGRRNPRRGCAGPRAGSRRKSASVPRVDHRLRAIGRRFVPDRRQAEHRPRIAGAQGADDEVVLLRRIEAGDDVLAAAPAIAELCDSGRAISLQPRGVGRTRSRPWRRRGRRCAGRSWSHRCR